MKRPKLLLSALIVLTFTFFASASFAQGSGPSDATTPPPTNATDVGKVLCNGQTISITGPQDPNGADWTVYHWYKLDAGGNKQLTSTTSRTYTEVSNGAGYYTYQVVTENASGCTSPISDPFKVYVLPPLTATITPSISTICAGVGNTILTANPTPATGYTLNYQWTRNGANIPGATGNTYTVSNETTAGTVTFGVVVSYTLNSSCVGSASTDIVIAPIPAKPTISAN
jgi:hypothetical protein